MRQLPYMFEYEAASDRILRVRVDGHIFIFAISTDEDRIAELRVIRGGRRSVRKCDHYRAQAKEFAWREFAKRGALARDMT